MHQKSDGIGLRNMARVAILLLVLAATVADADDGGKKDDCEDDTGWLCYQYEGDPAKNFPECDNQGCQYFSNAPGNQRGAASPLPRGPARTTARPAQERVR